MTPWPALTTPFPALHQPPQACAATRSACARSCSSRSPTWHQGPPSRPPSRRARELPSAGSLATYAARGLHPAVGFLTAWGYVLVGVLIAPLVLLQLGFTVASTINSGGGGGA